MALRPDQVSDRSLRIVLRGVSPEDVRAVLADAAEGYQTVLGEIDRLRGELEAVNARLAVVHADERETTRIISRAETDAGAIRQKATDRAAELEADAERRIASLLRDAEAERAALEALASQCAGARVRLARVLEREIHDLQTLAAGTGLASPAAPPAGEAPVPLAPGPPPPVEVLCDEPAGDGYEPLPAQDAREAWSADDIESALRSLASFTDGGASSSSMPSDTEAAAPDAVEGQPARRRYLHTFFLTGAGLAGCAVIAMMAFPRTGPDPAEAAPAAAGHRIAASPQPASSQAAPSHSGPSRSAAPAGPSESPAPAAATTAERADEMPMASAGVSAARSPARLVVRMQAARPCWIGVTIEGTRESRLLGQGEELVRESASDILLRAGDAGALVVFVNDRRLPPLGADGEVVTKRIVVPSPR